MTSLIRRGNGSGGRFPSLRTGLTNFFDIDSFFEEPFFSSPMLGSRVQNFVPATNIRETDKEYVVELAAPGMKKKDFMVDIDNGVLEIKVEKEEESKQEKEEFTRREYNYNAFYRSFDLPESVNADKIKAEYEDGLLKIHLPKVATATKKKVKEVAVA